MPVLDERCKAFTEPSRASEQINYAESGRQTRLLTIFTCGCILGSRTNTRAQRTDIVDQQTRSRMMSAIGGKNTKPELALRRALHARGFRFRIHSKHVYGQPDIVLAKYHAVVFVHGCFWHRHQGCRYTTNPSTRSDFWMAKFDANVVRDNMVRTALLANGWRVATVWECALRKPEKISATVECLSTWLVSAEDEIEIE
ncbi:very short patch repair endonuclease [Ensifer sp. Root558]|uniref:very short patch repair endonuclease n=1 Tax=Ensifer sp. Root558 TaxID=1736558 RepID=UPI0009E6891B|nr:very short patch repair endonuclease [Ensifer sp. Root558]